MTFKNAIATTGLAACVILTSGGASFAQAEDAVSKPGLERVQMLRVRLPHGLCEFEGPLPGNLIEKLRKRRDFDRLLSYMLTNCPVLALPLADAATASISIVDTDGDGRPDTPIIAPPPGDDGSDDDGPGDGGTGDDGSNGDDDGNNGHGNDDDRHDDSNPGKKS